MTYNRSILGNKQSKEIIKSPNLLLQLFQGATKVFPSQPRVIIKVTNAGHSHYSEECHFLHLNLHSSTLGHYTQLVSTGDGVNTDRLVNRVLHFHALHSLHNRLFVFDAVQHKCLKPEGQRCCAGNNQSSYSLQTLTSLVLLPPIWFYKGKVNYSGTSHIKFI